MVLRQCHKGNGDCFYGCSLTYASKTLQPHGYTLLQLDVWDAVYVRNEYLPLFGNVPHDDYSVFALRPPLADHLPGGKDLTLSVCHNASAVLMNVHSSTARLGFLWRYFQDSSGGTWPFTLDVDPVRSTHDELAVLMP